MGAVAAPRCSLDGSPVDAVPPALALHPFGTFTTFVAVDRTVLAWSAHEQRLVDAVAELWGHELDRAVLRTRVRDHLARGAAAESVRVTVWPAELDRARPAQASGARVLVSSTPCTWPPEPAPLTVRSVEHVRGLPHVKSTDLLVPLALRRRAQLSGADDALLVDGDRVLEGPTWSVLVWTAGTAATPDRDVLASITAAQLGRVAEAAGRTFTRRAVGLAELATADLVLAVNVNAPCRPVTAVDGRPLTVDHALLREVAAAYDALGRDTV